MVLASVWGNLAAPAVAKQMRRLLGARGGAARGDVPVAADRDAPFAEENAFEVCVAYRPVKKKSGEKRREDGEAKRRTNKVKGQRQSFYGDLP